MNNATNEDYLRDEAQRDMDNVIPITKYELSTGCWIDDRWGIYGAIRSIEIAQEYGFVIDDTDREAIYAFQKGVDTFFDADRDEFSSSGWILDQGGLADIAEDWMNENVAKPGFQFGWVNGEWFYMKDEWWDDYEETTDIDRKNP